MAFGALILVSGVYSTGTTTHKTLLGSPTPGPVLSADGTQISQFVEEATVHYANKSGAGACNHIRLSVHDGNVRDALEAYQKAASTQINAIGRSMERLEDEDLKELIPAIEALICE